MLGYALLTAGMGIALAKRKPAIAVAIAVVMLIGGLVLGFLWLTSPM